MQRTLHRVEEKANGLIAKREVDLEEADDKKIQRLADEAGICVVREVPAPTQVYHHTSSGSGYSHVQDPPVYIVGDPTDVTVPMSKAVVIPYLEGYIEGAS